MLQCYPNTVLLILLYGIVLTCQYVANITRCYSVTLLQCYQCYCMPQCFSVAVLLVLLCFILLPCFCTTSVNVFYCVTLCYPNNVLLMFLYGTVLHCYCVTNVTDAITLLIYCVTNVTIQHNVSLSLCYQDYCIIQCYPATVLLVLLYAVLPCYFVTDVTLCYNLTKLLPY